MNEYECFQRLQEIYREQYESAGCPCTWVPNEPLYHAIETLKHALGLCPSDVDHTAL